jgi:hypothetical protein
MTKITGPHYTWTTKTPRIKKKIPAPVQTAQTNNGVLSLKRSYKHAWHENNTNAGKNTKLYPSSWTRVQHHILCNQRTTYHTLDSRRNLYNCLTAAKFGRRTRYASHSLLSMTPQCLTKPKRELLTECTSLIGTRIHNYFSCRRQGNQSVR